MEHNAIALASTLRSDYVVELGIDKNDPPLFQLGIEKPDRGSDAAFLLALSGITDPEVLNRPAIHHPAEMEFAFLV